MPGRRIRSGPYRRLQGSGRSAASIIVLVVPIARASVLVDATIAHVTMIARDVAGLTDLGMTATPAGVNRGLVGAGDRLVIDGVRRPVRVAQAAGSVLELRAPRGLTYRETYASTAAGTLVTLEMRWRRPGPTRRRVLDRLGERCASLERASRPAPVLVVAAAIVRDGALLAARRPEGGLLGGRWELPGGKVEPGESPDEALRRECREELGVDVRVDAAIGVPMPLGRHGRRLAVYAARLVGGEPEAREHAELRWLGAEDLDDVDWLPADRAIVPHLRAALRWRRPLSGDR